MSILMLLKFLHYEGKIVVSTLEKELASKMMYDLIYKHDGGLGTNLFICMTLSTFDNPDSWFEKVKMKELSKEQLGVHLGKIDCFDSTHKPLIEIIIGKPIKENTVPDETEDEMENKIWNYGKGVIRRNKSGEATRKRPHTDK